jgi:protein SCO1/2
MPNSKFTPTSLFRVLTFLSIVLFIIVTVFLFGHERKSTLLPPVNKITDFELTDSQNKTFNTAQLKGKIWTAKLFFTSCSAVCPVLSKNMASVYRSYQLDDRVHFVSITVNPDTDTPEILAAYAKRYNADPKRWHFLTGPIEKVQKLSIESLRIGNKDEPVFHNTHFVLVDTQGWIRGYYDGMSAEGTKNLFKGIAALLKETTR